MIKRAFVPTLPRFFPETVAALTAPPVSHRSEEFEAIFRETESHLRQLCGNPAFMPLLACGSGTFANDLLIWNFAAGCQTLVLVNGEFGRRLAEATPNAVVLDFGWGTPWDEEQICRALDHAPAVVKILGVYCETSTGMVNDIAMLDRICTTRHLWFGLDAISALGVEPSLCQRQRLAMATGTSGKALAALPGIAILLLNPAYPLAASDAKLPHTLRLSSLIAARQMPGMVRNTMSSLLLAALESACRAILQHGQSVYRARLLRQKEQLAKQLATVGISALPGSDSPIVTAYHRPPEMLWKRWLEQLAAANIELYTQVSYLADHRLFEIAVMGNWEDADLEIPLPEAGQKLRRMLSV